MKKELVSYTAASIFPVKVLQNINIVEDNKINPYHIQLNPTNICNLNCDFCSCSARDRKTSINWDNLVNIMTLFIIKGCKSVTITGGGEPLLYPKINELIKWLGLNEIQIGLVTNGKELELLDPSYSRYITWCRISVSDSRNMNWGNIKNVVQQCPTIDWSFSYVVTRYLNLNNIEDTINFANSENFTHVRLVSDLLDLSKIINMDDLKREISWLGVDDSKVIYQGRKQYTKGSKKCLISLLKPVVGADGKLYPCCGTQYAEKEPSLDYGEKMCMGGQEDIFNIWDNQICFDGSNCDRCYYNEYNELLELLTMKLDHKDFI